MKTNLMKNLIDDNLPRLYKRGTSNAILEWDIEVEENKYRTITGQRGGQKVISKWKKTEAKNVGKQNATSASSQAYLEALSKWKKKLKTGYFQYLEDIDNDIGYIEPMLAYPLISKKGKKIVKDRTGYLNFPIMVDRKYNGMRQIISKDGPFSRKGEEIKSAPHIWEALEYLFNTFPDLVIDGELYNHDFRYKLNELNKIVRITADHKLTPKIFFKSKKIVRYYVYDAYGFTISNNIITEETGCRTRRNALISLLKGIPYITSVNYKIANSMQEVMLYYNQYVEDGYEGAILRNCNAPYQHQRTNDLIKIKPFDDMEVTIINIIDPISGNWGGTAKTASVRMENGEIFTATFKGSRERLQTILEQKNYWIGKTVTITYNGFTGKGTPNYAQIDPDNCFQPDR